MKVAAQVVQVERNLADGVSTVDMRQDAAFAGELADLLDGQHQPGLGGDVAEDDDARVGRDGLAETADDFIDGRRRPGQVDGGEPNAIAHGLLFPAIAAAGMLLVGEQGFLARFHVQAIADDVVALGGIADQGQLIAFAIQETGQTVTQLAQPRAFLIAKPRIARIAKSLGGQHVVNGRTQHGQRRAAQRAAVQIDVVGGKQPLAAQLGPVALGVFRVEVAVRQPGSVLAKGGLCVRKRNAEQSGGNGGCVGRKVRRLCMGMLLV